MNFFLSIFVLECFIMPNRIFYFVFYIMNINIYNLFYIKFCTLACIWALFLRINLFVIRYSLCLWGAFSNPKWRPYKFSGQMETFVFGFRTG